MAKTTGYAKYRGKLPNVRTKPGYKPSVFEDDPEWLEKVNRWKRENYGANPEDANKLAVAVRKQKADKQKEALEAQVAKLNIEIEGCKQILEAVLESENLESVKLTNGWTAYIRGEAYPSIEHDKENPELTEAELIEFIRVNKLRGCMTLPYQTLKSVIVRLNEEGKLVPKFCKMYLKTNVVILTNGQ